MVLVIKPTAVGIWVDGSVGRAMAKQGTGSVHSPITRLVVSPEVSGSSPLPSTNK